MFQGYPQQHWNRGSQLRR